MEKGSFGDPSVGRQLFNWWMVPAVPDGSGSSGIAPAPTGATAPAPVVGSVSAPKVDADRMPDRRSKVQRP